MVKRPRLLLPSAAAQSSGGSNGAPFFTLSTKYIRIAVEILLYILPAIYSLRTHKPGTLFDRSLVDLCESVACMTSDTIHRKRVKKTEGKKEHLPGLRVTSTRKACPEFLYFYDREGFLGHVNFVLAARLLPRPTPYTVVDPCEFAKASAGYLLARITRATYVPLFSFHESGGPCDT